MTTWFWYLLIHLFFVFNQWQHEISVFWVCTVQYVDQVWILWCGSISCLWVSPKQWCWAALQKLPERSPKTRFWREPKIVYSVQSKAISRWRDWRIKLWGAQIEHVKPYLPTNECKLTSDIWPNSTDEIFTNPSTSVFLKSTPSTTSIKSHPGSSFKMHIPKLSFRLLVIGSPGVGLRLPKALKLQSHGGWRQAHRLFITPHLYCCHGSYHHTCSAQSMQPIQSAAQQISDLKASQCPKYLDLVY